MEQSLERITFVYLLNSYAYAINIPLPSCPFITITNVFWLESHYDERYLQPYKNYKHYLSQGDEDIAIKIFKITSF